MTPELIEYVRQRIQQGATFDVLMGELVPQGWGAADVQKAFSSLNATPPAIPSAPLVQAVPAGASLSPQATNIQGSVAVASGIPAAQNAINNPASAVPARSIQSNPIIANQSASFAQRQESVMYGGFWIRAVASAIDGVLLSFVTLVLGIGAFLMNANVATNQVIVSIFQVVIFMLYFSLFESSRKQGSIGKQLCGLAVTTLDGQRISFGRALARCFSKWVSSIVLFIGFLMVAFTAKKQGLHDMMVSTLVVKRSKPHVGIIVAIFLLGPLVVGIGGYFAVQHAFNSVFNSLATNGYSVSPDSSASSADASTSQSETEQATATLMTAEQYQPYLAADPTALSSQIDSSYSGTEVSAGPTLVYFDGIFIKVIAPVIPNLAGQKGLSNLSIDHILTKSGKDINDAKNDFETDIVFTGLDFSETDGSVPHLEAIRSAHLTDDSNESDIARIQGNVILKLPVTGGQYLTKSYPFDLAVKTQ